MAAICSRCRRRVVQFKGLCRACGRATGLYTKTTREVEAERIARREASITRVPARVVEPKTPIIDGVEYEVTFDGSVR